jgi:hypothetical protein
MLAVVSMALVSCGGGDGKSKSESKKPVVEMADPPFIFGKASNIDKNVPVKGCFKVKQVTVADACVLDVNVSVTLEALQDVDCSVIAAYIHVFDENMGDLTGKHGYGDHMGSVEKGDVIVITAKVQLTESHVHPSEVVRYVQLQEMIGAKF